MIRSTLWILALFFNLHSALAEPVPTQPCAGIPQRDCNPFMNEVVRDFHQAGNLVQDGADAIYSGECRYLSRDYSAEHTHYSGLYLVQDQGVVHFNGAFRFFGETNPYADWDFETVKEIYTNPFRFPMESHENHSMADYSPDKGIWRFWLSQNPETREIYLISYWGFLQRGFCRYQRHE